MNLLVPALQELPRLSGALRAFGEVSSALSREPITIDESLVRRKRKKRLASRTDEKSWAKLSEEILGHCSKQDRQKVIIGVSIHWRRSSSALATVSGRVGAEELAAGG